jgi:hypothetical protein
MAIKVLRKVTLVLPNATVTVAVEVPDDCSRDEVIAEAAHAVARQFIDVSAVIRQVQDALVDEEQSSFV